VNAVLVRASELARAQVPGDKLNYRGADLAGARLAQAGLAGARLAQAGLAGARLAQAGLAGANLRAARLIGADLSRADLTLADLTGADLRAASLPGANLATSLFLTQSQLDAAQGGPSTRLPPSLTRPAHWSPGQRPHTDVLTGPREAEDQPSSDSLGVVSGPG